MIPIVLFRSGLGDKDELEAIKKNFKYVELRSAIPENSLVIGRYSCIPFYKELEDDLAEKNSKLINSYKEHRYIADLGNWYRDLELFTPKTWNRLEDIPDEGPFFLKGETNSKKFSFDTHCFAKNKAEAINVYCRLQEDGLITDQTIYIRQFVPLKKYMMGLRGLPVSKEFRIFVCYGQVLSKGFYWSNYWDEIEPKPDPEEIPKEFIDTIIAAVGKNATFYVIDVAQKEDGEWIVVELNDGQQSGMSMNDPNILYSALAKLLWKL